MDRKIASDLANIILLSTKLAGKYKLEDYIAPGYIESFLHLRMIRSLWGA